jgi:hypothetical protein
MWKEAVVAKFKALFRVLSGRTEENQNNPQDSLFPGRDLNPGPLEYEAEVLTTRHEFRSPILTFRSYCQRVGWFLIS